LYLGDTAGKGDEAMGALKRGRIEPIKMKTF